MNKRIVAALLAGVMAFSLTACGGSGDKKGSTSDAGDSADMKIAMVTDSGDITDQSFNQTTYEACKAFCEENGLDFNYYKPDGDSDEARIASCDQAIADGYNILVLPGYLFAASVVEESPVYPDVKFIALDMSEGDLTGAAGVDDVTQAYNTENTYCAIYQEEIPGYMAGYAAVKMGYRHLGFLGGMSVPAVIRYGFGYVQGINAAAEEYGATYNYYAKYDAGFTDSALGSTVAGTFYDEGANVVFADAGVVGDGITAKAKELGKLAIQTDANLDAQQPGHVLTSVLKITGVPVKTITKAYAEGKIDEMDRFQTYNLASGATGITDLEEMGKHVQNQEVWNEIKEKVQAVSDKISSGEIKVTNKQLNEEFDESTCPNVVIKTN